MTQEEKIFAHAFTCIPGLGPKRLRRIQKYFGGFQAAWASQSFNDLRRAGLEDNISQTVLEAKTSINPPALFTKLTSEEITCLADDEALYPRRLKEIYSPPLLLYYRGQLQPGDDLAIAVVGTRKLTAYGKLATQRIVSELAAGGLTIVSGLAIGIDAAAHRAALDAGGRTIAVLGSGVDKNHVFPRINYRLAQEICAQGALISEYPPGMPALKQNFPVRNRLISGLSLATLVVEAGERSGALITAWQALEQNREVLAVPGDITAERSKGTNQLIAQGATLIRHAQDVFDALNLDQPKQYREARKILPATATEAAIYDVLTETPQLLDQIINLTKFDVNVISSTLSIMEIKGLVRNVGGNRYIRCE